MNFERIVQALCDEGVDFLIVGGWSAILHGSAHVTNDLDIFFRRSLENTRRLARALAPFHPQPRDLPEKLPFVWDEITLRNASVLTLSTDLGPVDLFAELEGLGSFEEVNICSVAIEAFGREVRTLDLRSLIKSKRAVAREKDLQVLAELESLLEAEDL